MTREKVLDKMHPIPEKPYHFLLEGTDHITRAILSAEVTGHLGTIQVRITDILPANESSSGGCWLGSQASPPGQKKLTEGQVMTDQLEKCNLQ